MKPVNRLLTALSAITVIITVERASPTTKVLLQPYSFLHLHEVVQIVVITASSTVVSFLLLRLISGDFDELRTSRGVTLGIVFILGTYFYATGNGVHEVGSFMFNEFCNTKHFTSTVCGSMYFNDYYSGNILYFLGLGLSNLALVLLEIRRPDQSIGVRDSWVTVGNGVVLALTFFAYDAFDRVWVGFVATLVYAVMFDLILLTRRVAYRTLPFTLYSAFGFSVAAVFALPVRLALQ